MLGFRRRRFYVGRTAAGFGVEGLDLVSGISITASYNARPGACVSSVSSRARLRRVDRVRRRTTEHSRSALAIDSSAGQRDLAGSLPASSNAKSLGAPDSVAAPALQPLEFGDPRERWLNLIADLIFDDLQHKRPP
jgi:hypothetical protein